MSPETTLKEHRPTIAAVVVTFNRREMLRRWIECMLAQTVLLDEIIVVDNDSPDGSAEMVHSEYPQVTLIQQAANDGPSAAAAIGMKAAFDNGHDWIWMYDDDAFPQPEALARALQTVQDVADENLGLVWLPFDDFGGWEWKGRKIPVSVRERSERMRYPFRIDQVDLNMTLIKRQVIERVGFTRPDFFIMLWSCEYCLRVAQAGFNIWVVPEILVRHEHAGSTGTAVWRSYYQTRNHLVMALEFRSPQILLHWFLRQIRFVGGTLMRHDRKWERIILRCRGVCDALRGRMGKIVDPVT